MTDWEGVPNDLDAAVAWNGSNHFFKGCTVYIYSDQSKRVERNMSIASAFNAPCYIDAALNWGSFTFLFKEDKFYRYSNLNFKFLDGPSNILALNGNIRESNFDAAVQWSLNTRKYIFKGTMYYRIDDQSTEYWPIVGNWYGLFESSMLPKCGCGCTKATIGDFFTELWEYDSVEYKIALGKLNLSYKEMAQIIVDDKNKSVTSEKEINLSINLTEFIAFNYTHGTQPLKFTAFQAPTPNEENGAIKLNTKHLEAFRYGESKLAVTNTL